MDFKILKFLGKKTIVLLVVKDKCFYLQVPAKCTNGKGFFSQSLIFSKAFIVAKLVH